MSDPQVINAEDFKLHINVRLLKDWTITEFAERELEINAPYNSLCSFGYNCGEVVQSMVHTVLAEGLENYKRKYKDEDGE